MFDEKKYFSRILSCHSKQFPWFFFLRNKALDKVQRKFADKKNNSQTDLTGFFNGYSA